jgi:GDP/UDP-N,N'-diacetylbacillosamine 2-epimerase (hydrolysing)
LAALAVVDVMVGNSSSGIIEAASFDLPVVDVGTRQQARECSANVVHTDVKSDEIAASIGLILANGRQPVINVYGDGRSAGRITELLATVPLPPSLLAKLNAY